MGNGEGNVVVAKIPAVVFVLQIMIVVFGLVDLVVAVIVAFVDVVTVSVPVGYDCGG